MRNHQFDTISQVFYDLEKNLVQRLIVIRFDLISYFTNSEKIREAIVILFCETMTISLAQLQYFTISKKKSYLVSYCNSVRHNVVRLLRFRKKKSQNNWRIVFSEMYAKFSNNFFFRENVKFPFHNNKLPNRGHNSAR